MKKVSLQDIASRLKVSKALVSFVLNGQGNSKGINTETQQRVLDMARTLNYKPNLYARGLRLGKSNTIGLVVADISNKFYAKIAKRIEEVATKRNFNVIFCSSDENPDKEIELIEMLRDRQVDGIIVSTTQKDSSFFTGLKKEKFPFVLIDRQISRLKTNYVGVDNTGGAYTATELLINQGCRRIGLLKISPSFLSSIKEREAGYREALKNNELRINSGFIREIDFNNIREQVKQELLELLQPPYSIDGLFSVNNNITTACMEFFKERNILIPNDLAIVSFDDIELFRLSDPTITAIAQPLEDIGEEAVGILLGIIEGDKDEKLVSKVLPVQFVERQSSNNVFNQKNSVKEDPKVLLV